MKTDSDIQHDVMDELEWEPSLDASGIGVAVTDGIVTLSGLVKTYAEKLAAETATRRVAGVRAVAEEITVRLASDAKSSDSEIAARILDVFEWNVAIPDEDLQVKVEHGWVTLTGTVAFAFQRQAAVDAAGKISGVVGIGNQILIRKVPVAADIRDRIVAAIRRQADTDAKTIQVDTDGDKVILSGKVRAWHERELAENAAWATPGVCNVEDRITIRV